MYTHPQTNLIPYTWCLLSIPMRPITSHISHCKHAHGLTQWGKFTYSYSLVDTFKISKPLRPDNLASPKLKITAYKYAMALLKVLTEQCHEGNTIVKMAQMNGISSFCWQGVLFIIFVYIWSTFWKLSRLWFFSICWHCCKQVDLGKSFPFVEGCELFSQKLCFKEHW